MSGGKRISHSLGKHERKERSAPRSMKDDVLRRRRTEEPPAAPEEAHLNYLARAVVPLLAVLFCGQLAYYYTTGTPLLLPVKEAAEPRAEAEPAISLEALLGSSGRAGLAAGLKSVCPV